MKIAINLLPSEVREQDLKNAKFFKVQFASVAIIMVVFFLASLVVGFRVLQTQNISNISKSVSSFETRITELKNTQDSIGLLKNRLLVINKQLGTSSEQTQIYKIVSKLLPVNSTISSLSIDKNSVLLLTIQTPSGDSVDRLVADLVAPEKNEDRIKEVALENISRGRDGIYRLSLKITPKF